MAHQNTARDRHEFEQWQGKEPGADWMKRRPYTKLWMLVALAVAVFIVGWLLTLIR
jgi:hypothetical protein